MTRVFLAIILLFVLLVGVCAYAAGTPSIFSYQGRLANSNGDLLGSSSGTTYYFKFSIWDNATVGLGTRLWPSSSPSSVSATVRQGVFNVNIGDTANGYPDSLDYNFNTNADIYLQVEVSSDNSSFETLSPRQRVSSAVFSQIAGAVSGTGQSSFGTTTLASNALVTIAATSTTSIGALIRASVGQIASLFRVEDSSLSHLFSVGSSGGIFASSTLAIGSSGATSFIVDDSGNVGIGTTTASRKFNVLGAGSVPQLRLGQSGSVYGEFYTDAAGDIRISSTGKNIRQNDENLWVCSSGGCDTATPDAGDTGNIIIDSFIIFDNGFKFKQDAASTTMYDKSGNAIFQFDEGE